MTKWQRFGLLCMMAGIFSSIMMTSSGPQVVPWYMYLGVTLLFVMGAFVFYSDK